MSKFRLDIEKALTGSTAGSILMQPEIDKVIGNLVDYKNPLRQNLPRKPGSGVAWYIVRRAVSGTTPASWVADTDETGLEDTGTYTQIPFTYRTCLARGKVTRKLQATGKTFVDVLATEMENKAIEFKNAEDLCMVAGSSLVNYQFDGLRYVVPSTQQVVAGCVPGSASAPAGGCALTLAELDEVIDKAVGMPDMLVMTKRSRRALNALLQISQRFLDRIEVRGGFKLLSYNDIPIFVSTNIANVQTVDFATGVTAETGGRTSTIYIIDTEHTWIGELTKLTVMPLAKKSSQYDEFDVFCDEVLVVRNENANSKLVGILAPGDLGG